MLLYIILPVIIFIPGAILCREKFGKIGRAIFCAYFGIVVCTVAAMRLNVGTDYIAYRRIYEDMLFHPEWMNSSRLEKGYYLTQYFLSERFPDFRVMFAVWAFMFSAAVAIWIYKNSTRPEISSVAFVMYGMFFYSMNFLRQYTAAVIILYAFENIKKKDFLRYLVMVLFATCFHWSAIIMIPFYFILQIKLQPILLTIYFVLAGLVLVFSWDVIEVIRAFYEKYEMTSSYLYETSAEMTMGTYLFYAIGYIILFALIFAFRKKTYEKSPDNCFYMSCMLFVVLFEFWGAKHAIISRFALFFVIPGVLGLLPDTINAACEFLSEKIKQKAAAKAIVYAAVLCSACYFYGELMVNNGNGCTPYFSWYSLYKENQEAAQEEPEQIVTTTAPDETTVTDDDYEGYIEDDEDFEIVYVDEDEFWGS